MLVVLKYNKRSPKHQLYRAGYKQRRWGDWIKEETGGRWHIHRKSHYVYDIHFDLYVEDRHFAPYLPIKTKEEINRILKASRTTSLWRGSKRQHDEITKLIHKYKD